MLKLKYPSLSNFFSGKTSDSFVPIGIIADESLSEWWRSNSGITTNDTAPVTVSSWTGKKESIALSNTTKADQPGYSNNTIDFSGTTKRLISNNPVFNFGDTDWTIVFRFTLNATGIQHILGKWNATIGRSFLFNLASNGFFGFLVSGNGTTLTTIPSTITGVPGVEYIAFLRHDSVNNIISIKVNDESPASIAHTTGVFSSLSTDFAIGGSFGSGGAFGNPSNIGGEMDLVVFNKVLTNQEMIDYRTELISNDEAPIQEDLVIVFDGDSLTRSHHGSNIEQYYPLQVNAYLEDKFRTKEFYSYGVGGQTLQQMMADAAVQIYSKPKAGKDNVLIAWEDVNALGFTGGRTAQQNYDDFITYFQGAKNAGFNKCILITTFYLRTVDGVFINDQEQHEADRLAFFEMVKNTDLSTVPWDYHIDMRDAVNIGGPPNQEINNTYFFDPVHPNQAGYDTGVIPMVINKLNEIYNL